MKKAICFLCTNLTQDFYDFCKVLHNKDYHIFICVDKNDYKVIDKMNEIKIIYIDNKVCEEHGFKGTVMCCHNNACSRDKALYHFSVIDKTYDYIWFIEYDVFVPDINTIINIDSMYKTSDLLCRGNMVIHENSNEWLWQVAIRNTKYSYPLGASMICAIRCSNLLMEKINEYATKCKRLFLDEAFFNSTALHYKLRIDTPSELKSIEYRKDWELKDLNRNNLYHPVKDINRQIFFRKNLIEGVTNREEKEITNNKEKEIISNKEKEIISNKEKIYVKVPKRMLFL